MYVTAVVFVHKYCLQATVSANIHCTIYNKSILVQLIDYYGIWPQYCAPSCNTYAKTIQVPLFLNSF